MEIGEHQHAVDILVPADLGLRFVNYLVDTIIILIITVVVHTGLIIGGMIYGDSKLTVYVIAYITLILYYTIFESASKGKTAGKYITRTRVCHRDQKPVTFSTALARAVCRCIPFDKISLLFSSRRTAWHDSIPKTFVAYERAPQASEKTLV